MKKIVISICLLMLIVSCSKSDESEDLIALDILTIGKGNLYGNGQEGINQQNIVINDSSSWLDLLNQMDSVDNISNEFIETSIDFTTYRVVAVFGDLKTTDGHIIDINVIVNPMNIVLDIDTYITEGNTLPVITQPFHIIKIPLNDLPVIFNNISISALDDGQPLVD